MAGSVSRPLSAHHQVWLEAHPHRNEEWLREMTGAGFDVHHLDGDHANNDPANLVLIEHTDHMALHGGRMLGRLRRGRRGPSDETLVRGEKVYRLKVRHPRTPWRLLNGEKHALALAKKYALARGQPWPIRPAQL